MCRKNSVENNLWRGFPWDGSGRKQPLEMLSLGRICHLEGQQCVKAPRGASRCVPAGGEGLGQNSPPQRAADLRLSALTATASTSRGSFGSPGAVGVSQSTTFETCSVRTQRQQRLEPRAPRLGGLALISASLCVLATGVAASSRGGLVFEKPLGVLAGLL